MTYRTIKEEKKIQFLDKKEVEFYKQAEKTDGSIKVFEMSEKDFLYLNWRKQPPMTEEEIEAVLRDAQEELHARDNDELPEDIRSMEEQVESVSVDTEPWDLSGSIYDCIKRYAAYLSQEQLEEVLEGLEAGLSEKQVKTYFGLPLEQMIQYKRAYLFGLR